MKTARRRMRILLHTAAALASANALAQIAGPSVRTPNVPGFNEGPRPTLVSPANNAHIETRPTQSSTATFSWQPPPGNVSPQRYMLCIAPAGSFCGSPDSALYNAQTALSYNALIPPRFHDKMLTWTVGACGPGFGGGVIAAVGAQSSAPTDCSWAQSRTLNAMYQAQALNLLSPGDRTRAATPTQRFTWSGPPRGSGGIDGYRFCLAASTTACTQASLPAGQGIIVSVPSDRQFADVDVRPFRQTADRTLKWTVLSCKSGTCSLAANQVSRDFIIGAQPPAPTLLSPNPGSREPVRGDVRTHGYVRQEDGREVRSRTFPAAIDFKWTAGSGVTQHKLCIARPNVACGNSGSQVLTARFRDSESLEWQTLGAFHGADVNWTVQACDALGCGPWAGPRPLHIKGTPPAPTLVNPSPGFTVMTGTSVTFTWQAAAEADNYEVWIGQQKVATSNTSCTLPRIQLPEGPVDWTVSACNVVACGPGAQPRSVTINQPAGRSASASTGRGGARSVGARAFVGLQCN